MARRAGSRGPAEESTRAGHQLCTLELGRPLPIPNDADLAIDNNAAERAPRRVAIGRKNWMFAGSDEGGRRAAVIYSFIESCRRHGIDPFEYLRDVLNRVSTHPAQAIDDLLPTRWKEARVPGSSISTDAN